MMPFRTYKGLQYDGEQVNIPADPMLQGAAQEEQEELYDNLSKYRPFMVSLRIDEVLSFNESQWGQEYVLVRMVNGLAYLLQVNFEDFERELNEFYSPGE